MLRCEWCCSHIHPAVSLARYVIVWGHQSQTPHRALGVWAPAQRLLMMICSGTQTVRRQRPAGAASGGPLSWGHATMLQNSRRKAFSLAAVHMVTLLLLPASVTMYA